MRVTTAMLSSASRDPAPPLDWSEELLDAKAARELRRADRIAAANPPRQRLAEPLSTEATWKPAIVRCITCRRHYQPTRPGEVCHGCAEKGGGV